VPALAVRRRLAARQVVGWDSGRLAMLLAVLETRCAMGIGMNDVYLNVAGGCASRSRRRTSPSRPR
jgi:predicted ATP-dependent serine protease